MHTPSSPIQPQISCVLLLTPSRHVMLHASLHTHAHTGLVQQARPGLEHHTWWADWPPGKPPSCTLPPPASAVIADQASTSTRASGASAEAAAQGRYDAGSVWGAGSRNASSGAAADHQGASGQAPIEASAFPTTTSSSSSQGASGTAAGAAGGPGGAARCSMGTAFLQHYMDNLGEEGRAAVGRLLVEAPGGKEG